MRRFTCGLDDAKPTLCMLLMLPILRGVELLRGVGECKLLLLPPVPIPHDCDSRGVRPLPLLPSPPPPARFSRGVPAERELNPPLLELPPTPPNPSAPPAPPPPLMFLPGELLAMVPAERELCGPAGSGLGSRLSLLLPSRPPLTGPSRPPLRGPLALFDPPLLGPERPAPTPTPCSDRRGTDGGPPAGTSPSWQLDASNENGGNQPHMRCAQFSRVSQAAYACAAAWSGSTHPYIYIHIVTHTHTHTHIVTHTHTHTHTHI